MRLTILGNNGPFPAPGGACSGYLIQQDGTKILIDCGNGVLSNLQRFCKIEELDAIILTHLHSDHVSDMMVLKYALQIKNKRAKQPHILPVYASSEPIEEYQRLQINDVFALNPISEGMTLQFGKLTVTFKEMTHPSKDFAVRIENGEKCFVFSGDTNWNDRITPFSQGADFLMLDAGLLSKDKIDSNVPHLTAKECGLIGKQAQVKRLMLTHFWPEYPIEMLLDEAREHYQDVEASVLLASYEI